MVLQANIAYNRMNFSFVICFVKIGQNKYVLSKQIVTMELLNNTLILANF